MNRVFAFINLAIDCGYSGVNHGVAYLTPIIRKHGWEVRCLNLNVRMGAEQLPEWVSCALGVVESGKWGVGRETWEVGSGRCNVEDGGMGKAVNVENVKPVEGVGKQGEGKTLNVETVEDVGNRGEGKTINGEAVEPVKAVEIGGMGKSFIGEGLESVEGVRSRGVRHIVAFSSTSHQLKFLKEYANAVAGMPGVLLIAGGVGSTLDPEWILVNTAVHGTCVGEGEGPLEDLLARLDNGVDIAGTRGFWWNEGRVAELSLNVEAVEIVKRGSGKVDSRESLVREESRDQRSEVGGQVRAGCGTWEVGGRESCGKPLEEHSLRPLRASCEEFSQKDAESAKGEGTSHIPRSTFHIQHSTLRRNPSPPFVSDLSTLDFPDYSIFDRSVVLGQHNHLFVMLGRGCPYNCFYCCNKALQGVYKDHQPYFRMPTVDWSIRLLRHLLGNYPQTTSIEFEDDLLIANKSWFLEFAQRYRAEVGLPYRACVRVECVTPEIVSALKDSGCRRVLLGLESGNEAFRKKYLNRQYSNDLLVEKARMLRKADLDLFTFNIVGFPFETPEQMRDTLELNRRAKPDGGVCTFFYPYKHTQLYRIAQENGLLRSDEEMADITNYNTRPAIKMDAQTERQCVQIQQEIADYLEHRRMLWRVSHSSIPLPRPLKKFASPAWYAEGLRHASVAHAVAKAVYRASGMKRVMRGLQGYRVTGLQGGNGESGRGTGLRGGAAEREGARVGKEGVGDKGEG